MKISLIAIATVLLLALLAVSQAASSNEKLVRKLNHWVKKADQARQSVDLSKITDPKVKKLMEKLNGAIQKAQNARRVVSSLKKKKNKKTTTETEEALSDASISNGATLKATTGLNVRSGPCTTKSIVRGLSTGQTATFTGQTATGCGYTWYSINGGWVASNFVTVVGGGGGGGGGGSTGLLSIAQLKSIMPNLSSAKANDYIGHINNALSWGAITSCARKSAFLAQLAHESAELRYMEEIASGAAYEGRKDLGNIYPGDGRRYKGRGPIQLTGRANYRSAGRDLGVDLEGNPTLAATPAWGFKIAAWYWKTRSLNQYADQTSQASFDTITKRINGGFNGKADRDKYWRRAKGVLGC